MPVVLDHEKVFEHFSHLPTEVRMVVNDEMQPADRCRFTRCSRQSQKEARDSKNYLHELRIYATYNEIIIFMKYTSTIGYFMRYYSAGPKKICMIYNNQESYLELWRQVVQCPTDLVQFASQCFKNLLQLHQNSVKVLALAWHIISCPKEIYTGLGSLNRLEKLEITGNVDAFPFLSKLRHPLKILCLWSGVNHGSLKKNKQMYAVSKYICSPTLQLTYAQFLRLSASGFVMNIGQLTVQNIVSFIKSWQNGEIRENFERCEWEFINSRFDINELFNVFGIEVRNNSSTKTTIKHSKMNGKKAQLEHLRLVNVLQFTVRV